MCVTTVPHPWTHMYRCSLICLLRALVESVPVLLPNGLPGLGFRQCLLRTGLGEFPGASVRQQHGLSVHEAGLLPSLCRDDLCWFF